MTLLFFTLMELLQAVSYIWLGQCDVSANVWLTRLSYIHICFQIPVLNAFALSFVSEQKRKKWFKPVMIASFAASFLMLASVLVPIFWDVPKTWLCKQGYKVFNVCSDSNTCTYAGNWHLAWRVSLFGPGSLLTLLYFVPVFVFPVLYGSWRWTLYHFVVGPMLAALTTNNPNEVPAIWCLFSIGIFIAALCRPVREWLETPMRSAYRTEV